MIILFCGMMSQALALPCEYSPSTYVGNESRFKEQAYLLPELQRKYDFVLSEMYNLQGRREIKTFKSRGDKVSPNGVFLFESKNSLKYVEKKDGAHREWLVYDLLGKFKSRPTELKIPFSIYDNGVFRQIFIPETIESKFLWYVKLRSHTEIIFPEIEVLPELQIWLDAFYYLIGNADGNFMSRINEHIYAGKNADVLVIDHADSFTFGVESYIPNGRVKNGFNHYTSVEPRFNLKSKAFRAFVLELQSGLGLEIRHWFLANHLVREKLSEQQQEAFLARLKHLLELDL
ncbi:MAG: hypothetical protein VX642_01030 [Bdellovibrionota bacterium]|nr:hypothetical protein [Bdellovibrionota bacterium]